MGKKIVVVGSSNTDMIIKVPWLPKPGETILGGKFFTAAGGKVSLSPWSGQRHLQVKVELCSTGTG